MAFYTLSQWCWWFFCCKKSKSAVSWVSRVNYFKPPLIAISLKPNHTHKGIDENKEFSCQK